MTYALKLLLPLLVLCGIGWVAFRRSFEPLLAKREYVRAWTVIVAITIVVFLSRSLALYFCLLAVGAVWAQSYLGGGIRGKLAAFMLILMLLPPLTWQLGGLGDINYVLALTGPRVLALMLLVGPAFQLFTDRRLKREKWVAPLDFAVLAYQVLKIALMVPHSSLTSSMRMVIESLLDVLLPYYVFSRGLRSESDLRFVLSHLMMGLGFVALVGSAEFVARHYFYSELQWVYGYKWALTLSLMRGDLLRVTATTPEPIILAFELIFALGLWTFLRGHEWRKWPVKLMYALLLACLFCTLSRGPWIGAMVFGLSLLGLRRMSAKAFTALLLLVLGAGVVVKLVGADQVIIGGLSALFGSSKADLDSINYRNQLLDTALALLRQSPWLGVPDYAAQMQALRQGEGIIDLVNSYIAIALDTGVIGVALFLLPYVLCIRRMLRVPGVTRRDAGESEAGWFAAIFCAMSIALLLTIFTTSLFFTMPFLLAMLLALPIARLAIKTDSVDLPLEIKPERGYGINGLPVISR